MEEEQRGSLLVVMEEPPTPGFTAAPGILFPPLFSMGNPLPLSLRAWQGTTALVQCLGSGAPQEEPRLPAARGISPPSGLGS